MALNGFKKILATTSFAAVSAFGAMGSDNQPAQTAKVETIQKLQDAASSRIINKAGSPIFAQLFQDQLKIMANTEIGASLLKELPQGVNYIIAPTPEYAEEEAGFWDGQNCTIYDDTLLSTNPGKAVLIAHETQHAIQGHKYDKDYQHMPAEQQIAYFKMMEIETRLQDALMKEELYNQNAPATRTYEFATADWMDFRRIKAEISKKNPNLSANQVERMAKTQFVIDTWEGNHQRREYDQKPGVRTFKDWIQVYNKNALRIANQRCWANVPPPDLTVDEGLVKRHHEIMQEFVDRMGIDAPASYFDDLRHDKTLRVIRDSQELAAIGKHFEKDLKMVVMPRDDFVQVGGIVVAKDNSTAMFSPEKRKEFEKEISTIALGKAAKQAIR